MPDSRLPFLQSFDDPAAQDGVKGIVTLPPLFRPYWIWCMTWIQIGLSSVNEYRNLRVSKSGAFHNDGETYVKMPGSRSEGFYDAHTS